MKPIHLFVAVITFMLGMAHAPRALAESAATLQMVHGVVHVLHAGGTAGLVHEGMGANVGDTITTERDASVMLVFADKGQVALRPETEFRIKAFHYDEDQPAEDNLVISLLKGGLRTITGYVSKRGNRDVYRLEAANATIGIRGTDFNARLCDKDCENEQNQRHPVAPSPSGAIGRVAELNGALTDMQSDGKLVNLSRNQPFFENDELRMGETGYALLAFTDGTRILLQAGSAMKMKNYHYEQTKPDTGNMLFEMLKGAARIVTGLIGKKRPERVQFTTVNATIGIRGTAFDLICGRDERAPCDGELFISMRDGTTAVNSGNRELEVEKGQTSYVAGPGAAPELMEEEPQFIKDNPNPVPENMPVDMDGLFGMSAQDVPSGLYATVNDGRIALIQGGNEVEIGKGESGVAPADGSMPRLLPATPAFQDHDAVLANFPFIKGLCGMP